MDFGCVFLHLLQNTMLVSTKVIAYLSYARLSYVNNWGVSMFTVVPLSYNVRKGVVCVCRSLSDSNHSFSVWMTRSRTNDNNGHWTTSVSLRPMSTLSSYSTSSW